MDISKITIRSVPCALQELEYSQTSMVPYPTGTSRELFVKKPFPPTQTQITVSLQLEDSSV